MVAAPLPAPGTSIRPEAMRVRWLQLAIGIASIVAVANLQYGWTLFVAPLDKAHHWGRPAIQVAFTLLVLAESWLLPGCGWLVDRGGTGRALMISGLLSGGAWVLNSVAASLPVLYVAQAIGGLGVGVALAVSVGNALKWFPDRRGLAVGLTSGAFGVGSAITIIPLQNSIGSYGYEQTFLWFGLVQGAALILLGLVIRAPRPDEMVQAASPVADRPGARSSIDVEPLRVLRMPVFWVMYAAFVMVCTGGLMVTAQLAPIAADWHLQNTPVTLAFVTLPALSFALSLDRVLNGITRPFFGWISDGFGRENTMFVAFMLEGVGIWALGEFGDSPVAFVLLTGTVFFAWGEIYSLFPALCTDIFGPKNAATNYGLIFTAKGTAALLVPLGSLLVEVTGSWHAVFVASCVLNILAAVIALLVIKPMRVRINRQGEARALADTLTAVAPQI